jgi:hypothetical protein
MEVRVLCSWPSCSNCFDHVIIYKFVAARMLLQRWQQMMGHLVLDQWMQRVSALSWLVNYVRRVATTMHLTCAAHANYL